MSVLSVVSAPARRLQWRSIVIDLDRECLEAAGQAVPASPAEFGVMAALISRRNLPLTKENIMATVFGAGHGRDVRQIDLFVARLRRSLAAAGIDDAIVTVPGRGYAVLDEADGVGAPGCRPVWAEPAVATA